MTPVEFLFLTPDGVPIANAFVEIQLSNATFDDVTSGVLMPRMVETLTDASGMALVYLRPSKVSYFVTVYDTLSDAVIAYEFVVPEIEAPVTKVRLQDLVITGPISSKPYDEAALAVIHDAKVHVLAALVESKKAAVDAHVSQLAALASEEAAAISANAAASGFDPSKLVVLPELSIQSTDLLVSKDGVGYRMSLDTAGMTTNELPLADVLQLQDFIVVTQNGVDKRVSLAVLADAIKQFNPNN